MFVIRCQLLPYVSRGTSAIGVVQRRTFLLPFMDDRRVRRPIIKPMSGVQDEKTKVPPYVPPAHCEAGPLQPVHQHWDAPKWDHTIPAKGDRARRNSFIVNEDKWKHLNSVIWPSNFVHNGRPKVREVFYNCEDIKYSPKKMWIVCEFIRGRAIEDALAQLKLIPRKGPLIMMECLEDAKKLALEHEIEYASNTWIGMMHFIFYQPAIIAEASCTQSQIIKGGRRHRGSSVYTSVYIRLEEGAPPPFFTRDQPDDGWRKMTNYMQQLRSRKIRMGL